MIRKSRLCPLFSITAYETGRRRIQVSSLPMIAKALHVTIEELIGTPSRASKRGPVGKLQSQVERINQLPRTKQQFVMQVIDSVLAQAAR